MTKQKALIIVFVVSVVGVIFSGTLTYLELFKECRGICPTSEQGGIFGVPVCVYGLGMYALIAVFSFHGIRSKH